MEIGALPIRAMFYHPTHRLVGTVTNIVIRGLGKGLKPTAKAAID